MKENFHSMQDNGKSQIRVFDDFLEMPPADIDTVVVFQLNDTVKTIAVNMGVSVG